jgi:hypothetical protein
MSQGVRLQLATGMNSAGTAEVLRTIALEGTAVSVWHRSLRDGFQAWIDQIAPEQLPALRTLVAVDAVRGAVLAACASAGTPEGPLRATLADDIATLARIFSEILAQPFLRLTLEVRRDLATPQFLMAVERARLFCSYRGRGVQFGAARPDGPPREILDLPTGSVAIFRGFLWRSKQLPGIVHRVPLAERPGERPLLLVIDPVDTVVGHG